MQKVPFSPPRIDQAIIDEVVATLQSGWITTGPRCQALEEHIAQLCDAPKVLCVSSATSGMELMLRWFGVQEGDEVIVPAYTYCSTANVVLHCGATPVMVDVYGTDGTIDVEAVERAITPKTKVVMPVDLSGMPVQYEALQQLLQKDTIQQQFQPRTPEQEQLGRILILTDAAHSLGATYKGVPASKWSDISVFSMHAVKNLTTAEGGAIVLDLPEPFDAALIYKRMRSMALHGQSKDAMQRYGKNAWEYDVLEAGYKCNLPDVLAAIGLIEIQRYSSDTLPKRKALMEHYAELLANEDWADLPIHQDTDRVSSYHLFLLRVKGITSNQRNQIIQYCLDRGVSVNVHYKPLPVLSVYKNLGYTLDPFPQSADYYNRVITLPVFYDLTAEQQVMVVETIKEAVREVTQVTA